MPSEPDNKMDDLLKTYAKKRQDEAGAPFELHPATRKLLQAEAAKLRPKFPGRKESWFGALLTFWPRYPLTAAVFLVLGIGAWSFFRLEKPPEQMALFDAEQNVPRQEPALNLASAEKKESGVRQSREAVGGERESLQRPAGGPAPAEPQLALREETVLRLKAVADESKAKRSAVELAANEALQKNLTPNQVAPSAPPASTPVPAPIRAPVSPAETAASLSLASTDAKDKGALKGAQAPYENYSKLPQLQGGAAAANAQNAPAFRTTEADARARQNSLAPAAQPTPPASVVSRTAGGPTSQASPQTTAATGADRFYSRQGAVAQTSQNATQSRNRFSQVQSVGRAAPTAQTAGAAAPVLAEFDFEQTGNRVRVVDADGSVYDGQIEDAAKADDNSKERARRDAAQTVELRKAGTKRTALADGAPADSPAWNFRDSGTNRTLQQAVTINGVFYANSTNLGGQAVQSARGALQTTQQPANANLPSLQRIQGRVQVGTGAETQLDAVRRGN